MAAHDAEFVFVFDRREKEVPEIKIDTGAIKTLTAFKAKLQEVWNVSLFVCIIHANSTEMDNPHSHLQLSFFVTE